MTHADSATPGSTGPSRTKGQGSSRRPDTEGGTATLFGPGSQFHEFFNDPRWALAMVRATVLEAAHPQIGAA